MKWNLTGLLIGNGWISPVDQYLSYLPYAYKSGVVEAGSSTAGKLEAQQAKCVSALNDGGKDRVDLPACEQILQDILRESQEKIDGKSMCINMYDVRLRDTYPSCGMNWPPDLQYVTPYLRRNDVLRALNIGDAQMPGWTECNGAVGGAFRNHNTKPAIDILPAIVEQIPTILFSGEADLICNHLGTEELINNMAWAGGKGFEVSPGNWAPRQNWEFEGESVGIYQSARNLTYILYHNSSHMVPFDFARRTRDMLDRFMGVDIGSIGGTPADSKIDGEKGPETSVGGHPNSDTAQEAEKAKIDAAKWHAYYKSGEVVLVIVIIAAGVWGWWVYKERRKRAGYSGLFGGAGALRERGMGLPRVGMGLDSFRNKRDGSRDVEAADFDESELDDLHVATPSEEGRYSVGSASDDDEPQEKGKGNGHA